MSAVGRRIVARRVAMLASGLLVVLVGTGLFGAAARPALAVDVLPPWQVLCPAADRAGPLPAGPHSLSGVVTNAGSEGVGGIRIYVSQLVGGQPSGRESTSTVSDGTWSLDGLGDAAYIVGYYDGEEVLRNGWYSSTGLVIGTENATPITIDGSAMGSIDVELPVEAPLVLSGTIVDQSAAPVSGIRVTATDVDFPFAGCADSIDGIWQMQVRTGRYIVRVQDSSGTPEGTTRLERGDRVHPRPRGGEPARPDRRHPWDRHHVPADLHYPGTVTDGAIPLEGISVIGCVDNFATCPTGTARTSSASTSCPTSLTVTGRSGSAMARTYRAATVAGDDVVPTATGAEVTALGRRRYRRRDHDVQERHRLRHRDRQRDDRHLRHRRRRLRRDPGVLCLHDDGRGKLHDGWPATERLHGSTDPSGDHPSAYLALGGRLTYDVGAALVLSVSDLDLVDVNAVIPNGYRIGGTLTVTGRRRSRMCVSRGSCASRSTVEVDGSSQTRLSCGTMPSGVRR